MSIFSKLFGKKNAEEAEGTVRVGGMEDFMTLIRVYYQAVMAAQLGISNINFLPDMAVFKRTLKIPTQNNKLGIAEKSRCKKMVMEIYGINESFFCQRHQELPVHVPRLQPRPDDAYRQSDAVEVPSAGHDDKVIAQHDRKDRTRYPDQDRLERRRCT